MKKMILLSSIMAVALTGCVLDPYDDGYRGDHRDRHGQYDRDRKDRDWKHKNDRDWKRDRNDRRDWRQGR